MEENKKKMQAKLQQQQAFNASMAIPGGGGDEGGGDGDGDEKKPAFDPFAFAAHIQDPTPAAAPASAPAQTAVEDGGAQAAPAIFDPTSGAAAAPATAAAAAPAPRACCQALRAKARPGRAALAAGGPSDQTCRAKP